MSERFPKISVITPSFNQGDFLEATIRSVLEQEYPTLEYFVIDGASNDNSLNIIKQYGSFLTGWVSEPDRGQAHAINKGFKRCTGDIVCWLNSDDRLEEGALLHVANELNTRPDIGVLVGDGRKVDVAGKVVYAKSPGELTLESMFRWMDGGNFMQPSCFFRKSVLDEAGALDESLYFALDVDLWLRMVKLTKFGSTDSLLSTAVAHEDAKTTALVNQMKAECTMVITRAGGMAHVRHHMDEMAKTLARYQRLFSVFVENRTLPRILRMFRRIQQRMFRETDGNNA